MKEILKGGTINIAKKLDIITSIMWIVGIVVALAVGFALTSGTLSIPNIPSIITVVTGWVVIIGTALGGLMAILKRFS